MQYHAIPCNSMQYHAIQCNTIQYHASLITADGVYHCPMGSIRPFLLSQSVHFNDFSPLKVTRYDYESILWQNSNMWLRLDSKVIPWGIIGEKTLTHVSRPCSNLVHYLLSIRRLLGKMKCCPQSNIQKRQLNIEKTLIIFTRPLPQKGSSLR